LTHHTLVLGASFYTPDFSIISVFGSGAVVENRQY
jgi:hypothetical protein